MGQFYCPNCGPDFQYDFNHRCETCKTIILAREPWKEGFDDDPDPRPDAERDVDE